MFGCLLFMMRMKKIACLLAPTLQNRFLQKKQLISNLVNHMIFIQCNTVSQMVTLPDSIMIEHPPSTSVIFPPQIEEIPTSGRGQQLASLVAASGVEKRNDITVGSYDDMIIIVKLVKLENLIVIFQ